MLKSPKSFSKRSTVESTFVAAEGQVDDERRSGRLLDPSGDAKLHGLQSITAQQRQEQ